MTLTALNLRILNLTSLPDGGPLEASVRPGGMLEVGRDSGLDWCLPDPQRFISSRHFEIRSEAGGWMLYDLSTNGTFINGATNRVKSPCPLHDGDRLQVGQYSIEIKIQPAQPASSIPPGKAAGDIASLGQPPAPQPPAPESPAPESPPPVQRPAARSLPGGADPWAIQSPAPQSGPAPAAPPAGSPADIWAMPGAADQPNGNMQDAPQVQTTPPRAEADPAHAPNAGEGQQGWQPRPEAPAAPDPSSLWPPQPQTTPPAQQTAPPAPPQPPFAAAPPETVPEYAAPGPSAQALLEVIESAAGLAAGTLSRGDAQATAQEIGETLRALTEELSGLLQARAVARRSVRSAQVTMIGREDNNPLKFMPTPDQALGIMFGAPRPGFQRGPAAVRSGFADIKKHQYATHAALQPALEQLLNDLSPDSIEKRLDGVRLNRKSRAWEMYVDRWDAKTHAHENGMLDVFLAFFAEAYDRESGRP